MDDVLALWDYRRRVAELYRVARVGEVGEAGWREWRTSRDTLLATHPESPIAAERRATFSGLPFFAYDARWRLQAEPAPVERSPSFATEDARLRPFATFRLDSPAGEVALTAYWLEAYGGGVFLPFGDATNGAGTYGGGRYLLDTVKGADLGHDERSVTLDFNFAYHPSCVHDPQWACPLAPAENRLGVPVEVGERLAP